MCVAVNVCMESSSDNPLSAQCHIATSSVFILCAHQCKGKAFANVSRGCYTPCYCYCRNNSSDAESAAVGSFKARLSQPEYPFKRYAVYCISLNTF